MHIRPFVQSDFPAVQSIYQQGIDTGNATFQTVVKDWQQWDDSYLPHPRLVAELDGQVVGWATLSSVSSRAVYQGVAEVSIYIAPTASGRGVGSGLLNALITESESHGIWTLQAGIFPENKSSIAIHQKNGFKTVGLRDKLGQMNGVWRDILLLERRSTVVGTGTQ